MSNLNSDNNKLLYTANSSDGVSSDFGWTVDNVNNTASKAFELSTFQNCTTAFEIKYSNEGDGSDKYTGNGTESIVAGISYKQADGYTAISGTFDKTFATIEKDGNAVFTLTLSGKPDAALSGVEIGFVTVTIIKADIGTTTATIADEDADEPDEGATNETEEINAAPDEESNGDEIMTDTGDDVENGNEPDEGAESKTEETNTALDEGPNDTDTVTDTVEDTEEVSSEISDKEPTTE